MFGKKNKNNVSDIKSKIDNFIADNINKKLWESIKSNMQVIGGEKVPITSLFVDSVIDDTDLIEKISTFSTLYAILSFLDKTALEMNVAHLRAYHSGVLSGSFQAKIAIDFRNRMSESSSKTFGHFFVTSFFDMVQNVLQENIPLSKEEESLIANLGSEKDVFYVVNLIFVFIVVYTNLRFLPQPIDKPKN